MSRRGKAVGWLIGVVVLALIAAGLVYYLRSLPPTGGDGGGNAEPGNPNNGPVLMVKIDNIGPARPATGLGSADVIYVEPMEGGLTRIAAVFSEHIPSVVGPVRSARQTDYDLLAQYGKPTFAYSGAVPQIVLQLACVGQRAVQPADQIVGEQRAAAAVDQAVELRHWLAGRAEHARAGGLAQRVEPADVIRMVVRD